MLRCILFLLIPLLSPETNVSGVNPSPSCITVTYSGQLDRYTDHNRHLQRRSNNPAFWDYPYVLLPRIAIKFILNNSRGIYFTKSLYSSFAPVPRISWPGCHQTARALECKIQKRKINIIFFEQLPRLETLKYFPSQVCAPMIGKPRWAKTAADTLRAICFPSTLSEPFADSLQSLEDVAIPCRDKKKSSLPLTFIWLVGCAEVFPIESYNITAGPRDKLNKRIALPKEPN